MGGATCAAGLAPAGASFSSSSAVHGSRTHPKRGTLAPSFNAACSAHRKCGLTARVKFNPGNYYYVGGNTKLYGAVLDALSGPGLSPNRL